MAPPNRKYRSETSKAYRAEITERTAQGETCEQIATALREKGLDITDKTISRRRVEWGLRQRAVRKIPESRPQKPPNPNSKLALTETRKAEIEARTSQGESAEQIAAALEAQGHVLRKGSSTILRLQTQWGLIPPDPRRARGRKRTASERTEAELAKAAAREQEREVVMQQHDGTQHYPTNCSFGPRKRVNGTHSTDQEVVELGPAPPPALPIPTDTSHTQTNASFATEAMSVEFLVDLATSTLAAATHLKTMLSAFQLGQAGPNGQVPTREDLSTARRKVREAASVMHDLAVDPAAIAEPG